VSDSRGGGTLRSVSNAQIPGRPVVVILGMHRSGTSWLAGSLQERGLELGDVSLSNRHNARGNRENRTLMRLHEGVLTDSGGSWRAPPAELRWSAERRAALREFLADMNSRHGFWGAKDPRSLLLLQAWREEAPQGLMLIGIFRHPAAVHRSLAARDGSVTVEESARLWTHYNQRLLDEYERAPFPLLRFDVAESEREAALDAVCRTLGLAAAAGERAFFDAQLVHHTESDAVPAVCAEVWSGLLAASHGAQCEEREQCEQREQRS
jgi:hypothetical protein